jgi:hypothetical protein
MCEEHHEVPPHVLDVEDNMLVFRWSEVTLGLGAMEGNEQKHKTRYALIMAFY